MSYNREESKSKFKMEFKNDNDDLDSSFARDEDFVEEDFDMASLVENIEEYDKISEFEASIKFIESQINPDSS